MHLPDGFGLCRSEADCGLRFGLRTQPMPSAPRQVDLAQRRSIGLIIIKSKRISEVRRHETIDLDDMCLVQLGVGWAVNKEVYFEIIAFVLLHVT